MTARKGSVVVPVARGAGTNAAPRAARSHREAGPPPAVAPAAGSTSPPVVPGPRPVSQTARKRRPRFVF